MKGRKEEIIEGIIARKRDFHYSQKGYNDVTD